MLCRIFLTSLVLITATSTIAAEALRIGGTGSGTALMKHLALAYQAKHPENPIELIQPTLGSSGGLRALAAGHIDIAISGRPPRANEGTFKSQPYARTPLLFASNPAQPSLDFKLPEIAAIYAGHRSKWSDGGPIRLVLRSEFESDTITLRQISKEMDIAVMAALKQKSGPVGENDLDTIELIRKLPGSLGPTTLGMIRVQNQPITIHSLNGITPSVENLTSGQYPLSKNLYLNTRLQQDLATTNFLSFLNSTATYKLLLQLGYLPE